MKQLSHVAFCGGGSGGHISPAVAIAEEILHRNLFASVVFLTSRRSVDASILQSCSLPRKRVTVVQQPLVSSRGRIRYLWGILHSLVACLRHFVKHRPDVVVGTGGFASVPGVLAAALLRIPVVLFESNTVVGKANRLLSVFTREILTGWPITQDASGAVGDNGSPAVSHTGVPVRRDFRLLNHSRSSDAQSVNLLIIGGSQGALRLNQLVHEALLNSGDLNDRIRVLHQTGVTCLETVRGGYDLTYVDAEVQPHITDMAAAITQADLIVSRAGALSLAELAAIGRASILVPLSTAADNHQFHNASYFTHAGAAVMVNETDDGAAVQLQKQLVQLCGNAAERDRMASAAAELSQPGAAALIFDLLSQYAN